MERKTHIAVISVPIVSHQIAISEFCKKLIHLHPNTFHITLIIPLLDSLSNASKSIILSLSSLNIDTILLPPINLPPQTVPTLKLPLSMSLTMPSIIETLKTLTSNKTSSKVVSIIADYFAYEVFPFAKKLNILSYTFFPSSATVLSLCFHSTILDETISGEFRDLQEPINIIPGCVPIQGTDLPSSFQDRTSESYNHFLRRSKGINLCDGILVNSFVELESNAVKSMINDSSSHPHVYMVGPIMQKECDTSKKNEAQCLLWLDEQKSNSVIFVSFGSGGTISQTQMNELALGLELSNQKFLWVVREPNDIASANYFGVTNEQKDPLSFLPKGYLERTKKQGFLVSNWAPQVEILSHKAISGFVTHCGWFSTLECVVNGLPIIAWPLFAEQRMNAAILADGIKVAIRVNVDSERGVVEKGEIVNVLKRLMVGDEGIEIRGRMKVLQDAAADAIKVDGSSLTNISQLVTKWIN